MALKTTELSGGVGMVAECPYCSKSYRLPEDRRPDMKDLDVVQAVCIRCGSPMDIERSKVFAEEQAQLAHDPSLAAQGARLRGFSQAPAHTAILSPSRSK